MNWLSYAEGLATGLTVAAGCFTAGILYARRKIRSMLGL
jgi:hypothetical protein